MKIYEFYEVPASYQYGFANTFSIPRAGTCAIIHELRHQATKRHTLQLDGSYWGLDVFRLSS